MAIAIADAGLAATIGAVSAIATSLVKDVVIVRWNKNLDAASGRKDIFRAYVAPLLGCSEKLVWRFSEIFLHSRGQFLRLDALPLSFNDYKRQSTLYRIASLLGWMRAIQLELESLETGAGGLSENVCSALEEITRSLADGPEVELLRLQKLLDTWRLGAPKPGNEAKLAAELERRLYTVAGDQLKHDANFLRKLPDEEKFKVSRGLANFLCVELGVSTPTDAFLRERIEAATIDMSFREALIYRDWQDAIGDSMLVRDDESNRRYKIIGYDQFSELMCEGKVWIEVFKGSIVDVDFIAREATDYRATQIANLCDAVCKLIVALHETPHRDLVHAEALQEARKLLKRSPLPI